MEVKVNVRIKAAIRDQPSPDLLPTCKATLCPVVGLNLNLEYYTIYLDANEVSWVQRNASLLLMWGMGGFGEQSWKRL